MLLCCCCPAVLLFCYAAMLLPCCCCWWLPGLTLLSQEKRPAGGQRTCCWAAKGAGKGFKGSLGRREEFKASLVPNVAFWNQEKISRKAPGRWPILRFKVPPFPSIFPLLLTIFLHFLSPHSLYTLYTLPSTQKPKPSAVAILPQYHFSSPCKLSCSEPQRTRHSVELRSSSIFLRFPPALGDFPSFSVVLFLPFPGIPPFSSIFPLFSTILLRFFPTFFLSFLQFPPFSPVFNDFPSFSVVFFLPFSWHSSIFPLFSTIFLCFFPTFFLSFLHFPPIFLHFPWFFPPFFLPESTDLGGIEAYRHLFA